MDEEREKRDERKGLYLSGRAHFSTSHTVSGVLTAGSYRGGAEDAVEGVYYRRGDLSVI